MADCAFGILPDLHKGDAADGSGFKVGDGSGRRIYSTADERFDEFLLTVNRWGTDFNIQLGDFVDSGDSDGKNTFDALVTKFANNSVADAWNTVGNHEITGTMNETEWRNYVVTEHAANSVTIENLWQAAATYTAYTFDTNGFRFIVLNTQAGVKWDDDPVGRTDELSWLEDTALDSALPIIVFGHTPFESTNPGRLSDAALCTNIHNLLVTKGTIKAVIQAHLHKGWSKVVSDGIPYYGLEGSLLGDHLGDYSANRFYICEANTNGTIKFWEYERNSLSGRLKCNFSSLPFGLGRARSRYY